MPRLMDKDLANITSMQTASNFRFSAVKLDELGASEYTLVSIIIDVSSSVSPYKDDIEDMLKTVIESCKKSPRAENLMVRFTTFNANLNEMHGFRLLSDISDDEYSNIIRTGGTTALFDATYEGIEATHQYSKQMYDKVDLLTNAIVFIITDGADNQSNNAPVQVATLVDDITREESLESIITVLIGIDKDPAVKNFLTTFKDNANLDKYVSVGEATPSKLAKLAEFVSQSISSQSQSLGSGSASSILNF